MDMVSECEKEVSNKKETFPQNPSLLGLSVFPHFAVLCLVQAYISQIAQYRKEGAEARQKVQNCNCEE